MDLDPGDLIPHRPPILCVDALDAVDADTATGRFEVRDGPLVHDGALWELACIEGLAQTAAAIERGADRQAPAESKLGMLVGLRDLNCRRQPRAGETVTWSVTITTRFGAFMVTRGVARCGDEVICEGELKFYVEART